MQNAARDLVEHEGFVADLHGVAGVGATLVANDPVRALRQNVDELALALVAPLRADNDYSACFRIEHRWLNSEGSLGGKSKRPESSGALVQSTFPGFPVNALPVTAEGPRLSREGDLRDATRS